VLRVTDVVVAVPAEVVIASGAPLTPCQTV
jgi:hypothetical protein